MVTFTTKNFPDIVYIDEIAENLLRLMGHSGSVPGAILPEDLPGCLENFELELAKRKDFVEQSPNDNPENDNEEPAISLRTRAKPLIELMTSAINLNHPVSWK